MDSEQLLTRTDLRARTAPATGFFRLSPETRNDVYKKVLAVAHPLYLFQDTASHAVETFAPEKPVRWLALLYTNRQVHDEASAVLYGSNHFTFVDTTQQRQGEGHVLQSFLHCIGSVNAGLLAQLCINFPAAENIEGQPGEVMLAADGLRSLELLQEECTGLITLETLVFGETFRGLIKASHDDWPFVQGAITQIDVRLRNISSLSKATVTFNDGHPPPSLMEVMQGHRWVMSTGR